MAQYFDDVDSRIDLISMCMVFHWLNDAQALAAYKAASNPGARWIIYNLALVSLSSTLINLYPLA